MANHQHLKLIKQGDKAWNTWRREHPNIKPKLSRANLSDTYLSRTDLSEVDLSNANLNGASFIGGNLRGTNLSGADLIGTVHFRANLRGADLSEAKLGGADLSGADLTNANLANADLRNTDLSEAKLVGVNLVHANLTDANLRGADLSRANLQGASLARAILIETILTEAILTNCLIYGISVWDVRLEGAKQEDLIITFPTQPMITIDNLKVAQFIYLLLNNAEIRDVIDTIARKAVLILGRFTPKRKIILDGLRDELRKHDYLPILFDFEKPANRDITETIFTLAHLARFVIADLTDAKSIPQELMRIVPNLPSVPVQPLLLNSQREYGMFEHFTRYPWVLPIYHYTDEASLLQSLKENIIEPVEKKTQEQAKW